MGSVVWKLDNLAGKREKRGPGPTYAKGHPEILMANRAIWSMRLRHEWLATPLKKPRMKKSQRVRVGLEDALQRKSAGSAAEQAKAAK